MTLKPSRGVPDERNSSLPRPQCLEMQRQGVFRCQLVIRPCTSSCQRVRVRVRIHGVLSMSVCTRVHARCDPHVRAYACTHTVCWPHQRLCWPHQRKRTSASVLFYHVRRGVQHTVCCTHRFGMQPIRKHSSAREQTRAP